MKRYRIMGWVDMSHSIELGMFETQETLHDTWDIIMQIFDDGTCLEGIFAEELI